MIVRDAVEAVDQVRRFEESVEYIDFFPQIEYVDKRMAPALRLRLVEDLKPPTVIIDFSTLEP